MSCEDSIRSARLGVIGTGLFLGTAYVTRLRSTEVQLRLSYFSVVLSRMEDLLVCCWDISCWYPITTLVCLSCKNIKYGVHLLFGDDITWGNDCLSPHSWWTHQISREVCQSRVLLHDGVELLVQLVRHATSRSRNISSLHLLLLAGL